MAAQTNNLQVVNNFTKGMNKDLDNSLRSSDMYYDAEDLRLVVNDKGEYGALKNYNGILNNTLNLDSGQLICGTIAIREELIIFTTNGTDSHIYKATLDDDGIVTNCILLYDDSQNVDSTNLNFSTEYKIKGVGRYESTNIKKIYWVDGLNKIRFANVATYLTDDGLAVDTNNGISVNQMEFVQDATLPILTLDSVINGDITSGIIQYAYQFYNLNGSESLISEFTHPIHVTPESEQELTDVKYGGADSDVFTGKGFKLKLDHNNTLFDRIRLIAIEYKTLNGSPTIRIVEEKVINGNDDIYFYDSGNSVGDLTFEEVTVERGGLFVAQDIEVKDNILFAANITDETFDVDFDARAYRFSGASASSAASNYNISFLNTHDGADDAAVLTDSTQAWTVNGLVGDGTNVLFNITDGSRGIIVSNTATTITTIEPTAAILSFATYDGGNKSLVNHDGTIIYDDGESVTIAGTGNVQYNDAHIITKIDNSSFVINELFFGTDTGTCYGEHTLASSSALTENLWDEDDKYFLSSGDSTRSRIYDENNNYYEAYGDNPASTWKYYTALGVNVPANDVASWSLIPETFDCINLYNNADNDQDSSKRFIYQSNGERLGGEGPNVSYEFKIRQQVIDYDYADAVTSESGFTTYSNPIIDNLYRGYPRDEVYRLAIIFKDTKGRKSYPKWIGDIRTPKVSDKDNQVTYGSNYDFSTFVKDTNILANVLYIKFTVTNAPYDYEIVRVKRNSTDRSVLAQGININTTSQEIDSVVQFIPKAYHPGSTGDLGGGTKLDSSISGMLRFFSPEVSFNKNLTFVPGDYIEVVGKVDTVTEEKIDTNYVWVYKDENLIPIGTGNYNIQSANDISTIDDGRIVTSGDGLVVISSDNYSAYADADGASATITLTGHEVDPDNASFYSGISFVYQLDNTTSILFSDNLHITNYKRNVYYTQYGGNTYNARSLNNYIRCSDIVDSATTTVNCYGGDTFISVFGVLLSIFDLSRPSGLDGDNTLTEYAHIPLETSINLNLRHDDHLNKVFDVTNVGLLQEVAGTHEDLASTPNIYVQNTDLYLYNTVYSQDNIVNTYFAEPTDFVANTTFDFRILNSQVKINGETSDSWTKFLVNDYIEVDSKCGPINNIKLYNNRLFFFQDHGFGIVSVNERSLIADNNPGQLVLGTGGVLDRYDYMSNTIGNTNRFGLGLTPRGLYWLDNSKRDIYRFSDSLHPLASTKGMKSFLNSYRSIDDVVVGYDNLYEEVLFTIQGSTPATIVSYATFIYNIRAKDVNLFRLNTDRKYLRVGSPMTITTKLATDPVSSIYPSQVTYTTTDDLGAEGATINLYFNNTLCFSESGDVFSEFKSPEPFMYVNTNYNLMSVYPNATKLGTHNMNTRGKNYDAASDHYSESKLSILVNDKYSYTKSFDSLAFATNTIDSNNLSVYKDTFNKIRFRNSYQNTDWKDLTYHTMTDTFDSSIGELGYNRRESYFTTTVPRNIVNIVAGTVKDIYLADNLDVTQLYKDRIRGNHMIVDFKYANDASDKIDYDFSVSYVKTNYRLSFR